MHPERIITLQFPNTQLSFSYLVAILATLYKGEDNYRMRNDEHCILTTFSSMIALVELLCKTVLAFSAWNFCTRDDWESFFISGRHHFTNALTNDRSSPLSNGTMTLVRQDIHDTPTRSSG